MYTYINRDTDGIYAELPFQLNEDYNQGTTWNDYISGIPAPWILLSKEQVDFRLANPMASAGEVFNMQLEPIPEPPAPEPEPDPLDIAKQDKLRQIIDYDRSDVVNSFLVNGVSAWLTPEVRANYKNSIESAELLGETEIIFIIAGIPAKSALHEAKVMLAKIQRYADKCTIRTEMHKSNVRALVTVETINAYDYTIGYPEKQEFTLTPMIQNR